MSISSSKLAENSLSTCESVVMGVAGAAPAYSVSVATATLIAAVGTLAPASTLYCGLIMLGITLAFFHLNRVKVNAGAAYAWVTSIFGPFFGFFTGWALLVSSALFMVSGSIPAATATLLLIQPDKVNDTGWVTMTAAFWLTAIAAITFKGIKAASFVQSLMTGIELLILIIIMFGGIIAYAKMPSHVFSFHWLSITGFSKELFATGALTALFLFWGWDVTLNLSEETKNTSKAPGWGAFWSVVIIILLFVSFSISALIVMSDDEIAASGTNILFAIADKIFPRPWSYLAVLSVMLSSVGTLETTILQFTRTMFAKGRDNALHPRYAKIHHKWSTPWVAILFIWSFGVLFLFLSSFFSTVSLIIKDSVNAIGLQAAFYYSITGIACAWYHIRLWKTVGELIMYIIWPSISALFLIFIACFSIPTFDTISIMIGIGGIAFGLVPYLLNYRLMQTRRKDTGG